ncbi:UNVERIFIED_CONTAM: Retrovirus-related Pol polyprotein from transposon TNT 1-94 [Sesamum calycinum]|uniref:Retrovirus-related Pol polyprotein from transposon TNT 1-94 n=1 Tax=Sesamum calycinum TaxID=2727403 RepID=A0AAW2SXI7_9LAMI
MVEDKSIAEQTHEIINLEHALVDAEMKLPKKFLAMSIVDKFPKSWENFGMTFKRQKGRLSLDDLMIAISIEEQHRNQTHKMSAITGMMVSMGNSSTAEVLGTGSVDLKFPSRRVLSLKRVHHVPTIRRNIISGYLDDGLFKVQVEDNKNDISDSIILNIETSTLWHSRIPLKHNTNTPFELWKEISSIEVNTIVEFRDAVFIEDVFPMKTGIPSSVSLDDSLVSTSIPKHVEKMKNVGVNPSSSTSLAHKESNEPRRSKRARVVKDFRSDFVTYNIEDDPVTFKDVMASSEAKQWKEVIKNKLKARLVAKDFKQNEGIDYFDTYSLIARLTTIQVLIALALVYNLRIHQMDVKIAFLYGELEKEIYMNQLEGFVALGNEHKVCKLVKSLHGLKQAPKQWHEKFDKTILTFGFTINENVKCISCKVKGDRIIILCLYVDDILLLGSCRDIITETKSFLKNKFEMKDMGEADVILGIKLIRSIDGIAISQSHYVEKINEKFGYQNSRIAKTPYDSSIALFKNESGVSVATKVFPNYWEFTVSGKWHETRYFIFSLQAG